MVSVPAFILRRLYVKGSLRNTPEGFQFELKNTLGSGYARRLLPLAVDDQQVPLEDCSFYPAARAAPFCPVSEATPMTLAVNRATRITVRGVTLAPGPHKIAMGFEVPGLGALRFDFTDAPADAAPHHA